MLIALLSGLLYPRPGVAVPSPPPPPLEEVLLELETDPGGGVGVAAWLSEPTSVAPEAPVVLVFHGNGENLETMRRAGTFTAFRSLGVVTLAVDYPGYGRSAGRPREAGVLATGPAALAWAGRRYPHRPVFLCGWSLGAAVAVHTAAEAPGRVDGLVALSPWTTLEDTVRAHAPRWVASWFFSEIYDSLAAARRVEVPALVIHGEEDRIIPWELGRRLADAFDERSGARWVPVPETGHNDLLGRERVWEELGRFFRHVSRASGASPPQ